MPTLWDGKNGMHVKLKYQITNYDANLQVSVYLAEDDRWFTILVALDNPNATRTFWHADLREALDLARIADLRMVSEEPPEETIDEGTEVTPSGPHTRYTRAELKES